MILLVVAYVAAVAAFALGCAAYLIDTPERPCRRSGAHAR